MVPGLPEASVKTEFFTELTKPILGESFCVHMSLSSIYSKSLQVKVMALLNGTEEWVGNAQISLAEFNPDDKSNFSKWYNIISMTPSEAKPVFREESSDDSTVISSQASTLTRNQNQDRYAMELKHNIFITSDDDEDDESESCEDQLVGETDIFKEADDLENYGNL